MKIMSTVSPGHFVTLHQWNDIHAQSCFNLQVSGGVWYPSAPWSVSTTTLSSCIPSTTCLFRSSIWTGKFPGSTVIIPGILNSADRTHIHHLVQ